MYMPSAHGLFTRPLYRVSILANFGQFWREPLITRCTWHIIAHGKSGTSAHRIRITKYLHMYSTSFCYLKPSSSSIAIGRSLSFRDENNLLHRLLRRGQNLPIWASWLPLPTRLKQLTKVEAREWMRLGVDNDLIQREEIVG